MSLLAMVLSLVSVFLALVELHGSLAQEPSVLIDTTVQEKNITYPTDAKLAIKIINRHNKLAKHHNIQQLKCTSSVALQGTSGM
jgi:hypothetical protein